MLLLPSTSPFPSFVGNANISYTSDRGGGALRHRPPSGDLNSAHRSDEKTTADQSRDQVDTSWHDQYEQIPAEYLDKENNKAAAFYQLKVYRDEDQEPEKDYNKEANDLLKILADPELYRTAQEPRVDTLMMNIFRISGSIAASGAEENKKQEKKRTGSEQNSHSKPDISRPARKSVSATSIGGQCGEQVRRFYSIFADGRRTTVAGVEDITHGQQRTEGDTPGVMGRDRTSLHTPGRARDQNIAAQPEDRTSGKRVGGIKAPEAVTEEENRKMEAKQRRPSVTFYLGEPSSREALYRKRKQSIPLRRFSATAPLNPPFLHASRRAPLTEANTSLSPNSEEEMRSENQVAVKRIPASSSLHMVPEDTISDRREEEYSNEDAVPATWSLAQGFISEEERVGLQLSELLQVEQIPTIRISPSTPELLPVHKPPTIQICPSTPELSPVHKPPTIQICPITPELLPV